MLGQSKTAHQAEIDAACESIDFLRFNVEFMTRIYAEQPISSPGMWNRLEYRPLEGFVFAVSPFNFTAIAANLTTAPALMGNTVVWKPAGTAMLSAYYLMRLFQEAGLPDGVINFVYGSGATIGDAALASPHLAGIHFTGSHARSSTACGSTVASNMEHYRNYPRIVGETGGKDFIVAHPSADVDALATAIVRGSFEYQGQKCSAARRASTRRRTSGRELRERAAGAGRDDQDGRRLRLPQLHGRGDRRRARSQTQATAIEEAKANAETSIVVGGGYDDTRGLLRRADGDRDARPGLPHCCARSSSARS